MLLPAPGFISSLATYSAEYWMCFRSFSLSSWSCLGLWPGRGREGGSCSHCRLCTSLLLGLGAVGRAKGSHCSSLLCHPFSLRVNTAPVPERNEREPLSKGSEQSCFFHHPFSIPFSEHAKCLLLCCRKKVLERGVDKGTLGKT